MEAEANEDDEEYLEEGEASRKKTEARGAGLGGGLAGTEVSFRVEARDKGGQAIWRGGDDLCAVVKGPGVAREVLVEDKGDGTYEFKYSVPRRGEYRVHIFLNGRPLEKSPYDAFFTAPPGARGGQRVEGNEGKAATLHVANLSPVVTLDQLKKLFSFCGDVTEARFSADGKNYAFVEFNSHEGAVASLALNGMQARAPLSSLPLSLRLTLPPHRFSRWVIGP